MKRLALFLLRFPFAAALGALWPMVGVGLVGYGAYLIYEPAAFIVVGSLMILDDLHATWPQRTQPRKTEKSP